MEYKQYLPSDDLSFLIKRVLVSDCTDAEEIQKGKLIPQGHAAVFYTFQKPVYYYRNGRKINVSSSVIITTYNKALEVEVSPGSYTMAFVFFATVFTKFFHFNLMNVPDEPFVESILLKRLPSVGELKNFETDKEKIRFFEEWIRRRFKQYISYKDDEIDKIYKKILTIHKRLNVPEVIDEFSINDRTFRRKLQQQAGI